MATSRQLRHKRQERLNERMASVMVGIDWLNEPPSKARSRMIALIEALRVADALADTLRARSESLPSNSKEARQLEDALESANGVLDHYRGTRNVWFEDDYRLTEHFVWNIERFQRDDTYYMEIRVMNFAFALLRRGSIQSLRNCRECKGWFYAITDHQVFCSSSCRQRSASHSKEFQKHRREYMKQYRRQEKERGERSKSSAKRAK